MRIRLGRVVLAVVSLAEVGAIAGTGLAALFLVAWLLLRPGAPHVEGLWAALPGIAMWAVIVGAAAGSVLLPLLGFTMLRRVPIGRALGYPLAGGLLGVLADAFATPPGPAWPVPVLMPTLALGGVFAGALMARMRNRPSHLIERTLTEETSTA